MSRKRRCLIISCCILFLVIWVWGNIPYYNARRLVKAIHNQKIEDVEALLFQGVDPNVLTLSKVGRIIDAFFESGADYPLTQACRMGNVEMVKLLLSYGAEAEPSSDIDGWEPLPATLLRYQEDDLKIVRLLLDNGADANKSTSYNDYPVFMAADMMPQIQEYDYTKLNGGCLNIGYNEAAAKGITEIVLLLLQEQSIDIQDNNGKTLLMFAVNNENLYLAETLLILGCDTSIKDNFGKTAKDYALELGQEEMMNLFK